MLRTVAISSFLFLGAISVANADVYRWVDEHGGVHYSDEWVPGSQVIKSNKPHPPSSAPAVAPTRTADVPKPTSTAASSADQDATKAMKQDLSKKRDQQCKEAKEKYDKAIEARRIYKSTDKKDVDGNEERQYLSDEEADAYRVKMRQEVQDLCGNTAK